jgi:integrase
MASVGSGNRHRLIVAPGPGEGGEFSCWQAPGLPGIHNEPNSALRAHQRRRRLRARAWNGKLAEDAYLFSIDEAGRHPVRADTVGKRFRALATRLGHGYTLYGLRHFMATQLGAVASASTVRERMGHGSLQVTSIYTHRVSEADRAAAQYLSELIDADQARYPIGDR